jgi:hypothetical protein
MLESPYVPMEGLLILSLFVVGQTQSAQKPMVVRIALEFRPNQFPCSGPIFGLYRLLNSLPVRLFHAVTSLPAAP